MSQPIKVVDADTHYTEPHDLWTKRAPGKFKALVPRVADVDGVPSWVIDRDRPIGMGASAFCTVLKDGSKPKRLEALGHRIETVFEAAWDIPSRLKFMDESGIWAQIMYPNVLGFGGQNTAEVAPDLRLVATKIYNDAMAEVQVQAGGRICPMALLPWWDATLAASEAERAAGMGLRGVATNSDPHHHRDPSGDYLPDLGSEYWNPLWDVCDDLKLPVNFHIGSSENAVDWTGQQGWPSQHDELRGAIGASMLFLNNARVVANILTSGLLDRYPRLKFVSVESGVGWLPFLLESLDYQLSEFGTRRHLEMKPSEYFSRNMYSCFWFEARDLSQSVSRLGAGNVMFETDFPHPTCLYPDPLKSQASVLGRLDEGDRRKVLSTNAASLYRILLD
jgi:predicted TIM-barrel fold metal-dependent hydrolase